MKRKTLLFGLIFVCIIGMLTYSYVYKGHRDIGEEKPTYTLTVSEIKTEFSNNYDTANQKFLNKTIAISGNITAVDANTITLNEAIFCTMGDGFVASLYQNNQHITVKGRCIGYDDLLEEIKLDQCTIIN